MRASRITVSCVGVQGADRNMLAMIADAGDGRLYMVEDIGALPKIFMKETQEAQKSQLVEDLDPRARRQEGRGDRGHERRERAAAARLRHDQAQADVGDDPDLRPRRADPRALALRRRHAVAWT